MPTRTGAIVLVLAAALPLCAWWFYGESFLSVTRRVDAEAFVVEGWIGIDGIRAAAAEFKSGGERYVITTGTPSSGVWNRHPISYADMARFELVQAGIPSRQIIMAPAGATTAQRTYAAAKAVRATLAAEGLQPASINLFTYGVHARRSRLVYSKVLGPHVKIGVIAWRPARDAAEPWWHSSNRAIDFLTESVGYPYEAVFSSGRAFAH